MALIRPYRPSGPTGRAWQKAFEASLAIGVGVVIGYYLDRWLGTEPGFLFVFMLAGLVACVRTLLGIQAGNAPDDPPGDSSAGKETPK